MKIKQLIYFTVLFLSSLEGFSQDYAYDAAGNLSNDINKKISSIHYNCLNLADTIVFDDGRRIMYTYAATGQKLREQVIDAGGKVVKKADYVRAALYNNDTLRQISHGSGRVVPMLFRNPASPWEYQYEQKDHLGNVRALLTSRQDIENNKATLESVNVEVEQNQFQRYEDARRINSDLFDHTKNGSTSFSQRLNGSPNEKYGLTKSVSVMPGDVINLEVFAKYVDQDASHWQPLLTGLMTQIANTAVGTVMDGAGYSTSGNTPFPFMGLNGTADNTDAGPKAYLNWLVFDHNYTFKTGGYKKINPNAKENGNGVEHDHLSQQLTIREPGFVYAYLSNEEASPVDVFFDDFSVELVKGPIVQQTGYDPFGLTVAEVTREHAESNNFLYNGKELQKDFDLNWYDYGARMYDAALGRWHVIDPDAGKYLNWSPYNYVMNNPVRSIDPDGRGIVLLGDDDGSVRQAIERMRKIPVFGVIVNELEKSKNVAVIRIAPISPEKEFITDYNNAVIEGETLKDSETKGTGRGSDFYASVDPTNSGEALLTVKMAKTIALAYLVVTGNYSQESLENETNDDDYATMKSDLFMLKFENLVRVYESEPMRQNSYTGKASLFDDEGDPLEEYTSYLFGRAEMIRIVVPPPLISAGQFSTPPNTPPTKPDFSISITADDF